MKILSVSDIIVSFIYSPQILERFKDIDLVISCGDLPSYYLEYITSMLNVPSFYVKGNHTSLADEWMPNNLHRRSVRYKQLIMAGVEGCLQYNRGPLQYTEGEMWNHVFSLTPSLFMNKLVYGRYLDIFVTHASPSGIHDQPDRPHQGIKAFRWLIKVFKPQYHFHGHIHVYHPKTVIKTYYESTQVINTYGFQETIVEIKTGK